MCGAHVTKKTDADKPNPQSRVPFSKISKLLTAQQAAYSDYVKKSIHLSKKITRNLEIETTETRGQYIEAKIVDSTRNVSEQYVKFFISLSADYIEVMKVRVHAFEREFEIMTPFKELYLSMDHYADFVQQVNSNIQFAANNALFSFAESKIRAAAEATTKPVHMGIFGSDIVFSGKKNRCHISPIHFSPIGEAHLYAKTQASFSIDSVKCQATLVIPGKTSLTGKFSKVLDATLEYIKNL